MNAFTGFAPPTENWSKLPHALIESLPLISTLGEMKVILYILRHTWGYQEFDAGKKITVDEFEHGRKRRDGSRLDPGIGMSKPTIIEGLRRAEAHGFIIVETDDRDMGRVKKFYSLNMGRGKEPLPDSPNTSKESLPVGQEPLLRTEKETIETYSEKKEDPAPDSAVTPAESRLEGLRSRLGSDPLTMAANCERAQQQAGKIWTVPVDAGGTDTAGQLMLSAWIETKSVTAMPDNIKEKFRASLSKLAETMPGITPQQAARAVEIVLDKNNPEFGYYTYSSPAVEKFKRDWTEVAMRLLSGQPGYLTVDDPTRKGNGHGSTGTSSRPTSTTERTRQEVVRIQSEVVARALGRSP